MYVKVNELPPLLQKALKEVSYGKKDISFETQEKVCLLDCGSDGRKGFAILVDFAQDKYQIHWGSWGGANIFNPNNSIDLDDKDYVLPENCCVIKGSIGDYTYAYVILHPNNVMPFLPAKIELSEKEQGILYAYGSLKSGPYRKEELIRIKATDEDVKKLIDKCFLKKNKVGISITTEGKNARISK